MNSYHHFLPKYNIIVEFSPGLTDKEGLPTIQQLIDSYDMLIGMGYKAYSINWELAKTEILFESNWTKSFKSVLTLVDPITDAMKTIWREKKIYNTNIWFCLVNPTVPSSCHHECP